MFSRSIMVGIAAVVVAALPASAQERGTVEFGAFASSSSYDNSLGMKNGLGVGGRVGVFVYPRLSLEFEAGGSNSGRNLGLSDVNVGILSARATAAVLKYRRVSVLLGAGVDHTDTYFLESYGVHGLLGAKFALTDMVALRVDGIESYMFHGKNTNMGLHLGFSIYRNPVGRTITNTVTRNIPATPLVQRPDSVSAYETSRLRGIAGNYQALRDSLARPRAPVSFVIRDTVVLEGINFEYDSASFTPDSRDVLDRVAKSMIASEWLNTSWEVAGHTSSAGTHEYNMALSQRRAEAVRAYLVSKGVSDKRLFARGYGEVSPLYPNDNEGRNWRNRRVELRRIQGAK